MAEIQNCSMCDEPLPMFKTKIFSIQDVFICPECFAQSTDYKQHEMDKRIKALEEWKKKIIADGYDASGLCCNEIKDELRAENADLKAELAETERQRAKRRYK